jgi:GTP cyclohydrolase I
MEMGWPHSEDALTDPQSTEVEHDDTTVGQVLHKLASRTMPLLAANDRAMLAGGDDQQLVAAVYQLLDALGINPEDADHTADTPRRAARMWRELTKGYRENPADHLAKTFPATRNPGLVIQSGILLQSVCAHHLLPFTGRATVAYRPSPGQQVVGLSKLSRLVQGYSARLQIQERIGAQVVTAIMDVLNPSGTMCLITAAHDCMRLRGVRDASSVTTTAAREGLLLPEEISLIQQTHDRHA